MVVFELNIYDPELKGYWLGKGLFAKVLRDKDVPKEYVGKEFLYQLKDGCTAHVSTRSISSSEANKIREKTRRTGFYGYDWMIKSICDKGEIIAPPPPTPDW